VSVVLPGERDREGLVGHAAGCFEAVTSGCYDRNNAPPATRRAECPMGDTYHPPGDKLAALRHRPARNPAVQQSAVCRRLMVPHRILFHSYVKFERRSAGWFGLLMRQQPELDRPGPTEFGQPPGLTPPGGFFYKGPRYLQTELFVALAGRL
jgi:hypothetical protein